MEKRKRSNGQKYYQLTQEAIDFFENHYGGSIAKLAREADNLNNHTVSKALKKRRISNDTAKRIRKVLQEAGFKGNVFVEVI